MAVADGVSNGDATPARSLRSGSRACVEVLCLVLSSAEKIADRYALRSYTLFTDAAHGCNVSSCLICIASPA